MNAKTIIAISLLAGLAATAMAGNPVSYTDWSSASVPGVNASASGTMTLSSGTVNVNYSGEIFAAVVNNPPSPPYPLLWAQPDPSSLPYTGNAIIGNAPTTTDIIELSEQSPTEVNTITFSQPVLNPLMLINSLGYFAGRGPSPQVSYVFNQSFTLLGSGVGFWGGSSTALTASGDTLTGEEGAGAIEFLGDVSSISWTTIGGEPYNAFTIGAITDQASVPDGGTTLGLLGMSLSCFWGFGRKK